MTSSLIKEHITTSNYESKKALLVLDISTRLVLLSYLRTKQDSSFLSEHAIKIVFHSIINLHSISYVYLYLVVGKPIMCVYTTNNGIFTIKKAKMNIIVITFISLTVIRFYRSFQVITIVVYAVHS